MTKPKYSKIKDYLKEQIQKGVLEVGDYLPSENELCSRFTITRTTARKALDELLKEGFIEKIKGRGSRVIERRKSLGLLSVKGFSEAVGNDVKTKFIKFPQSANWSKEIKTPVLKKHIKSACFYFERIRFVGETPVMHEKNWFPSKFLPGFLDIQFEEGSFFKTLSKNYGIEIVGSTSEIRAEFANKQNANMIQINEGDPLLHISIIFYSSLKDFLVYAELYCNTREFPVGNTYYL